MTPKEKALELVNKFAKLPEESTLMWYLSFEMAKKCALLAVDEIMKCTKYESPKFESDRFCENYWQEVKQEIEKL